MMPLFSNRKSNKKEDTGSSYESSGIGYQSNGNVGNESSKNSRQNGAVRGVGDVAMSSEPQKPKLVFHCQQAQGSPTGLISGFANVRELYQKIAECYDFPSDEVSLLNVIRIIIRVRY